MADHTTVARLSDVIGGHRKYDYAMFRPRVDARGTSAGRHSNVKPLRIAFLIDDWRVPNWVATVATDVVASDACEIVAVVMNRSTRDRGRVPSHYHPQANPFRLSQLYLYLDYRIFHPSPDALEEADLRDQLKPYPVVKVEPLFDSPYYRLSEGDQKRLLEFDIDVLLLFWSGLPDHEVSSLARYGVWFFRDQELLLTGHAPIGFWEVLNQHSVTMQCLQAQLASSPKAMTLQRYYGPSDLRSIRRARNNVLWKSASLMSRKLNELQRVGLLDGVASAQPCGGEFCPGEAPSNLIMLKTIASHLSRFVRDRANDLRFLDQWAIAYKYSSCEQLVDRNFADYHWLIPPKDRCWADPFPVQTEGQDYLFFEEFVYAEKKGHLCVAPIGQDGLQEEPKTILKREYHLSYPFVFSWQGERYLIPETQDASRIDVYKFDSFPDKLSHYTTLMDNVRACDTTLFEADGRWWMFVAIASQGTWNVDELFLFYADNPFGPWVPHRRNPIKADVRSARPAGRVFARQGKYYRPAQDCSHGYGYAIRLQEIKAISDSNYVEEEVEAILPDWSPDVVATHTLNVVPGLSVIDARKRRRR